MAANLQELPPELSKKLMNVVIVFIVQIFKNPSKKFAVRGFTERAKSFIIAWVAPQTPRHGR